jgi:hypothetical protein
MKSYEKINIREAQVAGQKFTVWSDFIARATFAENADGVMKAIRTSGYIHNELTVRKAIATAFALPTFRK